MSPFLLCDGILTGPTLCGSCVGNYCYCEFAVALSDAEGSISQLSFQSSTSSVFLVGCLVLIQDFTVEPGWPGTWSFP